MIALFCCGAIKKKKKKFRPREKMTPLPLQGGVRDIFKNYETENIEKHFSW